MVTGIRKENLVAEIKSGKHTLISGVSEELGGHDEGPGPHGILEAALAACTILTVQMYANRKNWPLESTDVEVKITSENKVETKISRKVSFKGDLTGEQKERLLDIANKCPIHNLLHSKIDITTELEK
jgi:putative redox protein